MLSGQHSLRLEPLYFIFRKAQNLTQNVIIVLSQAGTGSLNPGRAFRQYKRWCLVLVLYELAVFERFPLFAVLQLRTGEQIANALNHTTGYPTTL